MKAQCQKLSKRCGDMYCQHCKIAGHEIENCRMLGNKELCTYCRIPGHNIKVCWKVAALSVNAMSAEQQSQLVNMAPATFSRGWCAAITSTHEPMLTIEVMVLATSGGVDRPITVTALADIGASLCIMNSTA